MTQAQGREAIRTSVAAQLLDVTPATIRSYCEEGKLEFYVLPGGHLRVYRDSLDRMRKGTHGGR